MDILHCVQSTMEWNLLCILKLLVFNLPYGCQTVYVKMLCMYMYICNILRSCSTIAMANDGDYMPNKYIRDIHIRDTKNNGDTCLIRNTIDYHYLERI